MSEKCICLGLFSAVDQYTLSAIVYLQHQCMCEGLKLNSVCVHGKKKNHSVALWCVLAHKL